MSGSILQYGAITEGAVVHLRSGLLERIDGYDAGEDLSWQLYTYAADTVEALVSGVVGPPLQFLQHQTLHADVLGTLFFFLSLADQYVAPATALDKHGRVLEARQLLVRTGRERIPVVDRLVVTLFRALGFSLPDHRTALATSHDIDMLRQFRGPLNYLRTSARTLLKDRSWKKFAAVQRTVWHMLVHKRPDPFDTFDRLLDGHAFTERRIYFLVGGTTRFDGYYRPDDPALPPIFEAARAAGYRIGLHPSYDSYQSVGMILAEKNVLERQINEPVCISRQHWLRLTIPTTWRALGECGIEEDASLGYTQRFGFRAGTGFRFIPYDLGVEAPYSIIVDPLIVMDVALLRAAQHDPTTARNLLAQFLTRQRNNTRISFNFHNSIFDDTLYGSETMWAIYELGKRAAEEEVGGAAAGID